MEETKNRDVEIKLSSIDVVYYSLIQAGIPLIDNIVVMNNGQESLYGVRVEIKTEFDFIEDMEFEIGEIEAKSFEERRPKLSFHSRKIYELSEKVIDTMKIFFYSGEVLLESLERRVTVLPVNQWSGTSMAPETIASFVMPNVPEIAPIVSRASQILKAKTGDPSFDGYLSEDKNRVMMQLSAIYAAIYELNIVYSVLPASFEVIGQRVRTPQEVYAIKQGNCIEMSVLFASVCEAVGLNPFVVVIEGHAFAGCWLSDELFDTHVEPNIEQLNKRLAQGINDLVVLEATYMNQGSNKDFDQAMRSGLGRLEKPDEFFFVIDIKKCHYMGITPMPVRLYENGVSKIIDYGYAQDSEEKATVKTDIEEYFLDTSKKEAVTKSTIWMRNLLDLSKRNNLISFRPSLKNIQIATVDIAELEDALSRGDSFSFMEVNGSVRVNRKTNRIIEVENEQEATTELYKADFKAKKLRTFMEKEEMLFVLKSIYREMQKSIEENGASSLFLALGFLKWIDPKEGSKKDGSSYYRLAPLVLVPVELVRRSSLQYGLRLRDEDAQMNITLLEFLRQQFELTITGLNPLPEDEAGVDIKLVLNSIRKAVMDQKGWDVLETAVLGHFSFSQFVMWNDLKERFDRLTENKVVKALVDGLYISEQEDEDLKPFELDSREEANDVVIPGDVDSSQLTAVIEASKGRSFVLHGPPGTGKSQTIMNMIANALYQGKSVLFVAEKMAALNVVYDRLAKIGLEEFCLEIHSNKTGKRTVLEKFENCLTLTPKDGSEEYLRKSERAQKIVEQLNFELSQLHRRMPQGYSVFELISMLQDIPKPQEPLRFTSDELEVLTPEKWDDLLQTMRLIRRTLCSLETGLERHPLRELEITQYHNRDKEEFVRALEQIRTAIGRMETFNKKEESPLSFVDIVILGRLYTGVKKQGLTAELSLELWKRITDPRFERMAEEFLDTSRRFEELKERIYTKYTADVDALNIAEIKGRFLKAETAFLMKGNKIKTALLGLNAVARNGHVLTGENARAEFEELFDYTEKKREVEEYIPRIEEALRYRFEGFDKKKEVEQLHIAAQTVRQLQASYHVGEEGIFELYRRLEDHREDELEALSCDMEGLPRSMEIIKTFSKYDLSVLLQSPDFAETVLYKIDQWTKNLGVLKEYSLVCESFEGLDRNGFSKFKAGLLGRLRTQEEDYNALEELYLYSLVDALIGHIVENNGALRRFSQITTEEKIKEYNRLIDELEEIGKQRVREVLVRKLPQNRSLSREETMEMAGLTKIVRSRGRGTSIRKIFQQNSKLIKNLTPCLLMSPLSVAQYIDLEFPKFDIVIFDEASQIRTGVAVGAMSRAKDCIIVGDPNQMPPTSFFGSQKLDEDNLHIEDLESLLEDCLAINMPQKYLTWHYRSESESLIAFSNHMYYKNKMMTFPSPFDVRSRVSFKKIDGIYDRGSTRTNRAEAEAVVSEIIRRLKDKELCTSTIGVVTFNSTQQELIDDLLQNEFSRSRELESRAKAMKEPIFIKNLENVQGDERDVILFSVTYGRDESGRFYQNFGPLGKKGGWRRLNVAVSRARREMTVFSSITCGEFHIGSATSEGVVGLMRFLEFAQHGISTLEHYRRHESRPVHDALGSIQSYLCEQGYETEASFGASKLSLEVVVKNPKDPDHYICAILLDAKQYSDMSTMRDRNRLLTRVLDTKGWNTYRIWSLAYFENKTKILSELKAYLDRLVEEYEVPAIEAREVEVSARAEPARTVRQIEEVRIVPQREEAVSLSIGYAEAGRELQINSGTNSYTGAKVADRVGDKEVSSTEPYEQLRIDPNLFGNFDISDYRRYEGTPLFRDRSITEVNSRQIAFLAGEIISIEAPIVEELLVRRIMEQFKDVKTTTNMKMIVTQALEEMKGKKLKEKGAPVYFGHISPKEYEGSRNPSEDYRRDIDMIPLCELANRMFFIAWENQKNLVVLLEEGDLIKETVKSFGFSRTTAKMADRLAEALKSLILKKRLRRSGGRLEFVAEGL